MTKNNLCFVTAAGVDEINTEIIFAPSRTTRRESFGEKSHETREIKDVGGEKTS